MHRADVQTHTLVGRRKLAREWRVEMVLRRATSKAPWRRLLRRNMLSSCSRDRYILLAESTRSRLDVFTRFVLLQTDHRENIITPHASQPQIVPATFKCNTTTSDFPRQPQCLVPPTELSTGRMWSTPRDAGVKDLS